MVDTVLLRARFLAVLLATVVIAAPLALAPPSAQAAVKKPLDIVKIHYDPAGTDKHTNAGRTREYIQLKNTGTKTLTLTGYVLRDEGPQRFALPRGTKLAPGKTLTIRSGKGKNTASTLYWNKASYIWNNPGDTARLYNTQGTLLESCRYKNGKTKGTKAVRVSATTAFC